MKELLGSPMGGLGTVERPKMHGAGLKLLHETTLDRPEVSDISLLRLVTAPGDLMSPDSIRSRPRVLFFHLLYYMASQTMKQANVNR